MKWRATPGLWTCGPLSICRQRDERTQRDVFELYNTTTYVDKFDSLLEAFARAEGIGWDFELTLEVAS